MQGMIFNAVLVLLFSIYPVFRVPQQEDAIPWGDRALNYNDFRGKVPRKPPGGAVAETFTTITLATVDNSIPGGILIEVKAVFQPDRSWLLPGSRNPIVLNHEQRHFDITEYCTRLMRSRLKKFENYSRVFTEVSRQCELMQDDYDRETRNGIDLEEQQRWDRKVDSLLSTLKDFSGSRLMLEY